MDQSLSAVIRDFRSLRLAVVRDDLAAAQRSILVAPAREISENLLNRALRIALGLPFVAVSRERAEALRINHMPRHNGSATEAAELEMLVSVEAREGVMSGISMSDRANTVRCLAAEPADARALVKPGHIFPVIARDGGVLIRPGRAEAAADLVRLADLGTSALFVDILDANGELAAEEEVARLCGAERLPCTTISSLIRHRLSTTPLVKRAAEARLPSRFGGEARAIMYRSELHDVEHLAVVTGQISPEQPTLVRVQRESLLQDVFGAPGSSRDVLQRSLNAINSRGAGVVLYLRLPNSPGDLSPERPVASQQPATMLREYGLGAQILRDLGVQRAILITTSARHLEGLCTFGIEIVGSLDPLGVELSTMESARTLRGTGSSTIS